MTNAELGMEDSNLYLGCLKSVILTPFITVSFAGLFPFAEKAFQNLWSAGFNYYDKDNLEILLNFFLQFHICSKNETSFIISTKFDDPLLFKIDNGEIVKGENQYWIGDINGFREYQKIYHSNKEFKNSNYFELNIQKLPEDTPDNAIEDISKCRNAFFDTIRIAIRDQKTGFQTVGGTLIEIFSGPKGFVIFPRLEASGPSKIKSPTENWEKVDWGNATNGGFAQSTLGHTDQGIGIFGVYTFTSGNGYIFDPLNSLRPILEKKHIDNIKEIMKKKSIVYFEKQNEIRKLPV